MKNYEDLIGDFINQGAHRDVYAHKYDDNLVIKKQKNKRKHHNKSEYLAYNEAKKFGIDHWLAPVIEISDCGGFLIQVRGEPVKSGERPKKVPKWLSCDNTGPNQWVWINNRVVKCDFDNNEYYNLKNMREMIRMFKSKNQCANELKDFLENF